jgi:putative FmdB family regulatory protein
MPVYQYVCHKCEHKFEEFLKMSDHKKPCKAPCPACKHKGKVEQTAWGEGPNVAVDKNFDPLGVGNLDQGFRDRMKHITSKAPRFEGIRDRMKERWG